MNLLVTLDAGPEGEELLASARALSHVSGWPVRVLHVRPSADAPSLELPARLTTNTAVQEEVGDPAETILAAAQDDDVIAFAMRRAGEQGVGPVADALLTRAPQTLLVMRPGMRPISSLRRIVVPLEGSPSSSEAMRVTDEAFCGRGREIVVAARRHRRHARTSPAACRPPAWSTRSSTSGRRGTRSSPCASRPAPKAAVTARSCGSATRRR